MRLIIGLGNPGKEYSGTRHNVGQDVVRGLAEHWKINKKLLSEIATSTFDPIGSKVETGVLLALPTTYMNESGKPTQLLVTRYSLLVTNLIVVHDDIDLPLGVLRISKSASSGGHNGVQSIIDALGTKDFIRLRIGVAGVGRNRMDAAAYVLKKFAKTEQPIIEETKKQAREALSVIIEDGIEKAMTKYNGHLRTHKSTTNLTNNSLDL